MKYHTFEELPIWQEAIKLAIIIYNISSCSPWNRDFGLRDQIRRAIVSVSSNIVEGFEKNGNNEFVRYLRIAKGSVGETRNHLYIALSVDYISKDEFEKLNYTLTQLARQIGGFIIYLKQPNAL
jgi:four helix bundle protein